MLRGTTYDELIKTFTWQIPSHYNIGIDVCDKWAHVRAMASIQGPLETPVHGSGAVG